MKNKILAILLAFGVLFVIIGYILLIVLVPEFIYIVIILGCLFTLYSAYKLFLQKLNK